MNQPPASTKATPPTEELLKARRFCLVGQSLIARGLQSRGYEFIRSAALMRDPCAQILYGKKLICEGHTKRGDIMRRAGLSKLKSACFPS